MFCIDMALVLYDTQKSWAVFYLVVFWKFGIDRMPTEDGRWKMQYHVRSILIRKRIASFQGYGYCSLPIQKELYFIHNSAYPSPLQRLTFLSADVTIFGFQTPSYHSESLQPSPFPRNILIPPEFHLSMLALRL